MQGRRILLVERAVSRKSTFCYRCRNSFCFTKLAEEKCLLRDLRIYLFEQVAVWSSSKSTNSELWLRVFFHYEWGLILRRRDSVLELIFK